jgi:hypothetical protein
VLSTNWHNAARCMSALSTSPEGAAAASSCCKIEASRVTVKLLLLLLPWNVLGLAHGSGSGVTVVHQAVLALWHIGWDLPPAAEQYTTGTVSSNARWPGLALNAPSSVQGAACCSAAPATCV